MSSGVDRDEYIGQLRAAGWTAMEIADEVGLSRSQVHRILAVVGDAARGDLDDEGDWDDEEDEEDEAELLDAVDANGCPERVAEPVTYVGEDEGCKRYLDAAGRSLSALGWYRFLCYVENELEDRERGKRIRADMDRQIEAYEARQRV